MLDPTELKLLSRWCRVRRLHWQPGVADDGRPAVLLLGSPRQEMLLLPAEEEWQLLAQPGQVLAAASGLAELLDAVDGGVGEEPPMPAGLPRADMMAGGVNLLLA